MGEVVIAGALVATEADLHRTLAEQMDLGPCYGSNLAALRDRLLADVPRPVVIVWHDSEISGSHLGAELFGKVVAVFDEARRQDHDFGWTERFEYRLQ